MVSVAEWSTSILGVDRAKVDVSREVQAISRGDDVRSTISLDARGINKGLSTVVRNRGCIINGSFKGGVRICKSAQA